jgi:ketopantoate reductase
MPTLQDRIVWITGAGSGIGRAIAIGFCGGGCAGRTDGAACRRAGPNGIGDRSGRDHGPGRTGNESGLKKCIEDLTTDGFPFRAEANIQREIWKKAIINAVFNSICPLLDVDNGVFARDDETASLAGQLVRECVTLTDRLNIGLSESELMETIMLISKGSDQLISTLQDIRSGRQTEIEFLNLEIARVAASMQPRLDLPRIELLGKMILVKSLQQRRKDRST